MCPPRTACWIGASLPASVISGDFPVDVTSRRQESPSSNEGALTNWQTNSWSEVLQKLTLPQHIKKSLTFYGTRRYITMFALACNVSLSWARWIQSTHSNHVSVRFTLILSTQLSPSFPNRIVPSGIPIQIYYAFLLSPKHATCPTHICFDHPIRQWQSQGIRGYISVMATLKFAYCFN
jgi:hypothetical protein